MAKVKRATKFGSTPTIYKIPTDTKIEEILSSMKNNNNSSLGRKNFRTKKRKILEILTKLQVQRNIKKR